MTGLDLFKERFAKFTSNYVLIGGAACYIYEDINAQVPRATKDLDIILVVEVLAPEFGREFWNFVRDGEYEQRTEPGEPGAGERRQGILRRIQEPPGGEGRIQDLSDPARRRAAADRDPFPHHGGRDYVRQSGCTRGSRKDPRGVLHLHPDVR